MSTRTTGIVSIALALGACGPRGNQPAPVGSATSSASIAAVAPPPEPATPGRCAARTPGRIARAAAPGASSAVELVRAGEKRFALVADHDERALHTIDAESMAQIAVTPLPGRPGHVLALADGRVAVSLRDAGRVLVLEAAGELTKPLEERCAVTVAAEPWALAEAGERLLAVSGFGAALTVLGSADLRASRVIPLDREPRALLVQNRGATAFVTHAVGGVVSAIDLADASKPVDVIRLHAGRRADKNGQMDPKRTREASQGYALASVEGPRAGGERDSLRVFAPHTSVDPGASEVGATVGYGSGPGVQPLAPIVSVIDPIARRSITNHVGKAFHDAASVECMLPRGAVADERALFVACLDIDAVLELDPWIGDPMIGERRRIKVPAGPSALALAEGGERLFVWSEIDRALSRLSRDGSAIASTVAWRRAGEARDPRLDRGRRLFHTSRDARISRGRACASCHPDGRDDGLVWTSPDGVRQTPMLAGRLEGTAPFGWFGEAPTVRDHLQKTFARLGGTGFDAPAAASDLDALVAYVTSLPPPPVSPSSDAPAAERGRKVFTAYCHECHKNGGTDGLTHDVGSGLAAERRTAFDTPTLRGVRGTAPYFHDGRYATLRDLLDARDQRMYVGTLSDAEKRDLLTYLETL